MKRWIIAIVVLLMFVSDIWARHDVLYVYRNDGMINALLMSEIDSIRYSKLDLDSVAQKEHVVQEVWTVDSVYRIPLVIIDSVSFITPETVYKPGAYRLTADMLDYLIGSDSLTLFFKKETPYYVLPAKNDKLTLDEVTTALPHGFLGQVYNVRSEEERIAVDCHALDFSDVYSQYYSFYEEEQKENSVSRSLKKDRERRWGPVTWEPEPLRNNRSTEFIQEIYPDPEGDLAFSIPSSSNDEYRIKYTASAYLIVSDKLGEVFNINIKEEYKHINSFSGTGKISVNKEGSIMPFPPIQLPIPHVQFYFQAGAFARADASMSVTMDYTESMCNTINVEFNSRNMFIPRIQINHVDFPLEQKTECMVNGNFEVGAFLELGLQVYFTKWASVALRGELGFSLGGNAVLYKRDAEKALHSTEVYRALLDTEIHLNTFYKVGDQAKLLWFGWKHDFEPLSGGDTIFKKSVVPKFKNTTLKRFSEEPASLFAQTNVFGNSQLVDLGFTLFEGSKKEGVTEDGMTMYVMDDYSGLDADMITEFRNTKKTQGYTVYPSVKVWRVDVLAEPWAELAGEPNVITGVVTNITENSAVLSGEVYGIDNVLYVNEVHKGFCTTTDISSSDWNFMNVGNTDGPFSLSLDGLLDDSDYYYCAYACVDGEYTYGEIKSFRTKKNELKELREQLITFYQSTNGDHWYNNNNWCSDKPIDTWYGVNFINTSCIELKLDRNNLTGDGYLVDCKWLKTLHCEVNELTSLNITGCTSLNWLYCGYNNLSSLEVTGCTALTKLNCNYNDLTYLDLSESSNLQWLNCNNNKLADMNVSGKNKLETLSCNNNPMTRLIASECAILNSLDISHYTKELNLRGCKRLKNLEFGNTSYELTSLNVNGCNTLSRLICDCNDLTSLDVRGCTSLKELSCHKNHLTSLDVSDCTELEYLSCYSNDLTSLDVHNCKKLLNLGCSCDQLSSLNVDGCMELVNVSCSGTQLISLDLSDRTKLSYIVCRDNSKLESLDLSGCIKLNNTDISNFDLPMSLNLSGCRMLKGINCHKLLLSSLDISYCTLFEEIYNMSSTSQMTSINARGCISLRRLDCSQGVISSLDVNGCTALKSLYCWGNKLTSLDLTGCRSLEKLHCSDNQLTSLDLSDCTSLVEIYCSDNLLTSLDVSGFTSLKSLFCESNLLTDVNVSGCTSLYYFYCRFNHINREIPIEFDSMSFDHDKKYVYDYKYAEYGWDMIWFLSKVNDYGWWYPGEPGSLSHKR